MAFINNCDQCLEKQRTIDKLQEEIQRLKAALRREEQKTEEGYFGSSTPSSQKPFKKNTNTESEQTKGGACVGHKGNGRKSIGEQEADRCLTVEVGDECPSCHCKLKDLGYEDRSVVDAVPVVVEKIVYKLARKVCPRCQKSFRAKAPGVLPKSLVGNRLLSRIAIKHYVNGIPLGTVVEEFGLNHGTVVEGLHRLATYCEGSAEKLKEELRKEEVIHADETGWRNDGQSGYAWVFASDRISIFEFRDSRSGKIPKEVLGEGTLPGVLVRDRYTGYNGIKMKVQYCYAHLLRDVTDLIKKFPDDEEIRNFVDTLAPLLADAMSLRTLPISDTEYYERARELRGKIQAIARHGSKHLGIRYIQDILRGNEERLYQWVENRAVPAHNNGAERELRPTVIARKVSFGSQSKRGAKTRSILMTILHTLKKRTDEVESVLTDALNTFSMDSTVNLYDVLFHNRSPGI